MDSPFRSRELSQVEAWTSTTESEVKIIFFFFIMFTTKMITHNEMWIHFKASKQMENNTWVCGDMEFPFECSTRYLTTARSEHLTDFIHVSKRERAAIHSWRYVERVTCQPLIVEIRLFSVVEIPIKHSSLYNKIYFIYIVPT